MNWQTLDLGGKPADVYEPPGGKPRFGIIHLHGHGLRTLKDNPAFTRWFTAFNLACVCPHGQRSWWANRVCPEFDAIRTPEKHLLDVVMPYFAERWGLRDRAVGVQGISMGGQAALRLGFQFAKRFPVVGAIAAALDYHEWHGRGLPLDDMYDSKEQCRQDTAILRIVPHDVPPHLFFCVDPDDDDWYRGNDRLDEKLSALGIAHVFDGKTQAGGHTWDYFEHQAERLERFMLDGLDYESRRLL